MTRRSDQKSGIKYQIKSELKFGFIHFHTGSIHILYQIYPHFIPDLHTYFIPDLIHILYQMSIFYTRLFR